MVRVFVSLGEFSIKITLPKKWLAGPTENIKETFVEAYNKKHPEAPISCETHHLTTASGRPLASSAIVSECISHKENLQVKEGPSPPPSDATTTGDAAISDALIDATCGTGAGAGADTAEPAKKKLTPAEVAAAAKAEGKVRCRNYGCNQWFHEHENPEGSCGHHVKPPIFHETIKGWSCCEPRAWDWDGFMAIEPCTVGKHSTVDPKVMFAKSPTVAAADAAAEAEAAEAAVAAAAAEEAKDDPSAPKPLVPAAAPAPTPTTSAAPASASSTEAAPVIRSVDDYNRENPDAATAASSAVKTIMAGPPKPAPRSDGKAKCINKGCQQEYVVAENTPTSCCFHPKPPVFHDARKFWSCCPTNVKYDFDSFLAIPGCTVGPHNDGSDD